MTVEPIGKSAAQRNRANMREYNQAVANFSWENASRSLGGPKADMLNIAYEAVDRHVAEGKGNIVALRWISRDGARREFTYTDLKVETDRFARMLQDLGVQRGERVFSLLGRVPELYFAALGSLKAGAVFCPLFSVFGPEPVRARMEIGEASVLVTTRNSYQRKVASSRTDLPALRHVLLVDGGEDLPEDTIDMASLLAETDTAFDIAETAAEDIALLHFTSGTTGKPKGALHAHAAVIAHKETGRIALDLHPGDIYWCTADPGWVTGMSYGIIAPLTNGITMLVDSGEFNAESWYGFLEKERVTIWYTAPTAIRLLMMAGDDLVGAYDLSALRFMASVGEPLNPEAVVWSQRVFGQPFHDNWWQTETGGIMISNYAAMDVKPGSMGKPLPGIEAAIVDPGDGEVKIISSPMTTGHLALKPGWPSMFRGYLNEEARYQACFKDGWYLSGDLAMQDEDGYFWFVGRADDVIKSAGHLIGPFEVESALIEHPAVAEAAVIGVPDDRAGEIVKAYVLLNPGYQGDEQLQKSLLGHARKRLGSAIAPRQIVIVDDLPRTKSGKIMRRLLKARELGLPEGDLSTLERASK
ncbi:acetate--CoA ligase [Parasphingorhabdus sp.]|uniref:acetate--CoA ligase n=1 Tax=Parasphingorhabdus sp. TaxID=2709688 RepID=UPI003A93125C